MGATSIEWAEHSINPFRARNVATGQVGHFCEKISPGCAHCYASEWNENRFGTGLPFLPANAEKVELFLDHAKLQEVLRRKKPTKYFWWDMTDGFLDDYPDEWIDRVFAVMALTHHHTHMVLTKRAQRMRDYLSALGRSFRRLEAARPVGYAMSFEGIPLVRWPLPNVWCGVSVENQRYADERIPLLLQTPAAVRFLSYEPALGPLDVRRVHYDGLVEIDALTGDHGVNRPLQGRSEAKIDWIICGSESGRGARPMREDWVRSVRDQCQAAGVAFFLKQKLDERGRKVSLPVLDGRQWAEFPEVS